MLNDNFEDRIKNCSHTIVRFPSTKCDETKIKIGMEVLRETLKVHKNKCKLLTESRFRESYKLHEVAFLFKDLLKISI